MYKQISSMMRLTTIFIILTACQLHAASSFGQRFTLMRNSVTISVLFKEIKKQTGYHVLWDDATLKGSTEVKANFKNTNINEVLDIILKDLPVAYTIQNKSIILKPKTPSWVDKILEKLIRIDVRGKVVDSTGAAIIGANITVKGEGKNYHTNAEGKFTIANLPEGSILVVSFVGYRTQEIDAKDQLTIVLSAEVGTLNEVGIVSTGYQTISRGRTTGSFVQIDNKLLNRSVSTGILERVKDLVPGIFFENRDPQSISAARAPNQRNLGIRVRGESTLNASKQPLIILDNFPYEGEITNINPNDIENITILKDASAASIWGSKSANGVIIITTKTGKFDKKIQVDLNSNVTVVDKPDLKYAPNFLDANGYIEVEQILFNNNFFNSQLANSRTFPTVSPAVELMARYKAASSDIERSSLRTQLEDLKSIDIRDDYSNYLYQRAVNQQYSLAINGGTHTTAYSFSVGHDQNKNSLVENGFSRTSINTQSTFKPFGSLTIVTGLNYSRNQSQLNNGFTGSYNSLGGQYQNVYPYGRLSDENGNAAPILQGIRKSYIDLSATRGLLDWNYRPLDEIKLADNVVKVSEVLFKVGVKYQMLPDLSVSLNYQNQYQLIAGRNYKSMDSYFARNLINKFSVLDPITSGLTYNFPKGGILELQNTDWRQNNVRSQFEYSHTFNDHFVNIITGAEIREVMTEGNNRISYGYNDQFGTSTSALNYTNYYPINPTGTELISAPDGSVFGSLNRNISYYAIGTYSYKSKYTLNVSSRKDGANLFGAKANDRITPFWSAGIGWELNKELFYRLDWLSILRLRSTYGYQGNTYEAGSAYLTGYYFDNYYTGAKSIGITTAPNPRLRWEKVANLNIGIDFSTRANVVSGSIEFYRKKGKDLIQATPLAPQTGFSTYQANTAENRSLGVDINLLTQNINNVFKWNSGFVFSALKDEIVKYDVPRASLNDLAVGHSINSLFTYKWAGLNPLNGNPRGYLNAEISEDYAAIISNLSPDSLIYSGSRIPTVYGAFRNDFFYRGFNLSVNVSYRLGYVFKRSTTSLNYSNILQTSQHSDYHLRWKQPGDENTTSIPSMAYPANNSRNVFFQNTEYLVQSGNHIRLQDIRLGYELSASSLKAMKIKSINLFFFASNLGIIWRKNRLGLDPNSLGTYPNPLSLSFGLNTKL